MRCLGLSSDNFGAPIIIALVTLAAGVIQAAIDIRLFGFVAAEQVAAITAVFVAIFLTINVVSFVNPARLKCAAPILTRPYWLIAYVCTVYLIWCDAVGIVGAAHAGLRVVTGPQYLRMTSAIVIVVTRHSLRPKKALLINAVGLGPLLLQPLALLFPASWEARHLLDFGVLFGIEMVGCAIVALLTLSSSFRAQAASRVS